MSLFLGEYEMLSKHESGEGGNAAVYKVRHNKLGYVRALRVLHTTIHSEEDKSYQRFLEECRLLLRLNNGGHPNIVRIAQPRLLANKALVEMEWIDGPDMQDYIRSVNGFVPINEVLRFLQNIASALAYCHYNVYKYCINVDDDQCVDINAQGKYSVSPTCEEQLVEKYKIVHNDIHSKNVMRREDGQYILLDFGLAIKGNDVVKSSTRRGGADEYKAPEKWENDRAITTASDMYGFGILLFEMLTGKVPHPLTNAGSFTEQNKLRQWHENGTVPDMAAARKRSFELANPRSTWQQDYPKWLEDVIARCLEKEPSRRYKHGKELYAHVTRLMKEDEAMQANREKDLELQLKTVKDRAESLQESVKTQSKKIEELAAKLKGHGPYNASENESLLAEITSLKEENTTLKYRLQKEVSEKPTKDSFMKMASGTLLGILMGAGVTFGIINREPDKTMVVEEPIAGSDTVTVPNDTLKKSDYAEAAQNDSTKAPIENTFNINSESFKFTGSLSPGGLPKFGKAVYDDGSTYEGSFEESTGKRHGKGKRMYLDGSYYEGEFFKNDFRFGTVGFSDGSYYKGGYKNGNPTGNGTLYNKDSTEQQKWGRGYIE